MKDTKIFAIGLILLFSKAGFASEALSIGEIKELSYRGGWVTLKVVGADGSNYCEPCPADPGAISTKKCWINETKQVQISMLLSAQARGKMIYGRVMDFSSNCEIYQMTVED